MQFLFVLQSLFKKMLPRKIVLKWEIRMLKEEIDVLGIEIANSWNLLYALDRLIVLINEQPDVYNKYNEFWYMVYCSFYDALIFSICRLQDKSRDSLSINKIYMRLEKAGCMTDQEKEIFNEIKNCDMRTILLDIRDRLGRAHLEGKLSINIKKQKELRDQSKITCKDFSNYLEILTRALEILSVRCSENIIKIQLKPHPMVHKELSEIFNLLRIQQ
jgi:hypothetical protein